MFKMDKLKHHKHYPLIIGMFFLLVFLIVLAIVRIHAAYVLKKHTLDNSLLVVKTITAKSKGGTERIILPGNVRAWHEAPIYARTNGYIKKWYVDIGTYVKEGQLLAEIETPELDAQARQAAADLKTAIANNKLAQSTAKRWFDLQKTNSVSRQETDEKISSAQALQAQMHAAQANLDRLNQLVSFEKVIAPFNGTITARATDIGFLINSGSNSTVQPLFRIAETNPLRVYIRVPQYVSSRITPKMNVNLHFMEHPQQVFPATLIDTAKAIDPVTRTLLVQFKVENEKNILFPGSYTEVWFTLAYPKYTIQLPVNTLLFQAAGLQVATVDKNSRIQLKSVVIGRDFGSEIEIVSGIQPGDRVVLNPPDAINNNEPVQVVV